eukprot:2025743-Alexandrium_andersonii.AAC.1
MPFEAGPRGSNLQGKGHRRQWGPICDPLLCLRKRAPRTKGQKHAGDHSLFPRTDLRSGLTDVDGRT